MKTRTNVKSGGAQINHNQLKTRTAGTAVGNLLLSTVVKGRYTYVVTVVDDRGNVGTAEGVFTILPC